MDICGTGGDVSGTRLERKLVGQETHVIRAAVRVWKNNATEQVALERKLPIRLQRATRPRKSAQTAKKSPMMTKANMKRVSR